MLVLLFLACNQEILVTPSQSGCTNFDYNNPAEPDVSFRTEEDGAYVTRTNILLPESGLTFTPDLTTDHGVLVVRERWSDPETEDQFCYVATLFLEDFGRQLEVRWYVGEEDVPDETLIVQR